METGVEKSDRGLTDLLRHRGPMNVSELMAAMQVTATAVRQRLLRLMSQGLVERSVAKAGRGRPSHRYTLTDKGRRQAGSNFADLTLALWREIRSVRDVEVRSGLLKRISQTLARIYGRALKGETTEERMQCVSALMTERNVPFMVDHNGLLPVLTATACPYPQLAEQDRGICAMEKMLFSELVGKSLRLSECRLDGAACCRFEMN
ncbi:MAG: MarR family transcriptional regulator [Pirellulales bacterium]|nr:MarR family transcriptional regulator [Pirellulales bacterium]